MKYFMLILLLVSGSKAHTQSSMDKRLMLPSDRMKYKLDMRDSNRNVHAVYPLVNSDYQLLKSPKNYFFNKATKYNPKHVAELGDIIFGAYPVIEAVQGIEPTSELSYKADNMEQRFTYGGHISATHGTRFSLEARYWEPVSYTHLRAHET